jgi:hypothetical protein
MKTRTPLSLLLALFLLQSSCYLRCGGPSTGSGHTAGHNPMAISGPETWTIGGKNHHVQATYYLALPEGLQYTIDYQLPPDIALPSQNEPALAIAFPLMRHAFENNLHKRSTISKAGVGDLAPTRIGVALYHVEGLHRRGFAVALSTAEIQGRIASESRPSGAS